MASVYQEKQAEVLQDLESNQGSKVPGPEQALGAGVAGVKPGFQKPKRSSTGNRVPGISAAFSRKRS